MKRIFLNFRKLFLLTTAALMLLANVANTQTERNQSGDMKSADVVNAKSSALDLKAVGKEVAPGVLEVDPNAIRGKRLVFPPRGNQTARIICIGKWKNGECKGIYIEW